MSTLLENKVFHTENVLYSKFFVVNKESLAQFAKRIREEKDLSLAQVRERSGFQLATSYINRIENGEVTKVGVAKLEALAKGLGEPFEVIFSLARGITPNQENIIDEKFQNLSLKFSGIPTTNKDQAQALVDLMDREFDRLMNK